MSTIENEPYASPKDVQHGFQPIYYFSRCAGLWPFTISYNSNGSIAGARIHIFDILWLLTSICLYFTALFYTYEDIEASQAFEQTQFFATLIFFLNEIPPLLFGTIWIVLDMFNRNRLVDILKKFTLFDKKVSFFFKTCIRDKYVLLA